MQGDLPQPYGEVGSWTFTLDEPPIQISIFIGNRIQLVRSKRQADAEDTTRMRRSSRAFTSLLHHVFLPQDTNVQAHVKLANHLCAACNDSKSFMEVSREQKWIVC